MTLFCAGVWLGAFLMLGAFALETYAESIVSRFAAAESWLAKRFGQF